MALNYQIPCVLSQFVLAVSMDLIWVMFTFFIIVTAVFVVIGLFFPEWVGITGKKAHEIQRHQQEEKPLSETENKSMENESKK